MNSYGPTTTTVTWLLLQRSTGPVEAPLWLLLAILLLCVLYTCTCLPVDCGSSISRFLKATGSEL